MPNSILTVTAPTAAKPTYAERSRILTCMEFGSHLLENTRSREIDGSSSQWSHIFFDAGRCCPNANTFNQKWAQSCASHQGSICISRRDPRVVGQENRWAGSGLPSGSNYDFMAL